MSIRLKRKLVPPPQAVASSTNPLAVPPPQVAPYPYGLWFPPPSTPWLASPQSHAMSGSPAFPPPAAGKIDAHSDFEEWTEKRLSWMKDEDLRLEHVLLWNSWCCTSYSKMMVFQAMVV
ncbi:uncharacterized protein LOC102720781 isoform X2 [Oryza brachyantha]|uniref:uncharacterized protein LOC102720781 isoform X2 n=1 Tax=Oryza brachyantha TaxID=4533 RepID=UPI00077622C3|nr:uncharacterized protein LOC102720781 isoform X2 [Oryza brachyantha]